MSVRKLMDLDAPTGYKYFPMNESQDVFHLVPKDKKEPLTFTIKPKLPKKIDNFEVTPENFDEIMFITQKQFVFENNEVTVGDRTGKASELLFKHPYSVISEEKMFFLPEKTKPIDKPIVMLIGGEKVEFLIERIPYPSLKIQKFKSVVPGYISIEMVVYLEEQKTTFNYRLDYSQFEYIDEVLDKKNIILGLCRNDIKIEGVDEFEVSKNEDNSELKSAEYHLSFFERMLELQNVFGVRFKNIPLSPKDIFLAKKLYCSLVMNSFYSFGNILKSSYKLQYEVMNSQIKELLESDNPMLYVWREKNRETLMGCELHFVEIKYSKNIVFDNHNENEHTIEYKFVNDGQEIYKISLDGIVDIDMDLGSPKVIDLKNFDWEILE